MAVKLDREQQHTLAGILSVARKVRAPQKDILSAVETALVEANLRNPRSAAESGAGSGSSVGWRQETASSYPGVNRANVHGAAKRFFAELQKAPGGSSGQRAQAVQRSAYPGRYDQAKPQAEALLRDYKGAAGGGRAHGGGKGSVRETTVSGTIPGSPNPVTAADSSLTDLLTQSLGQTPAVQAVQPAPLQVPNFSARYDLRTPSGAAPSLPESGPAQSQSSQSDAVLEALQQLGLTQDAQDASLGSSPSIAVQGTVKGAEGGRSGSGGSSGYVHPISRKLMTGRIDQGTDWTGRGPLFAVGDGIVRSTSNLPGWPSEGGRGGVVLELTSGPWKGQKIFYAEGVTPAVRVGQRVRAGQRVGDATGSSIEVGFANREGTNALAHTHYSEGQQTREGKHFARAIKRFPRR